MTRSLFKIDTKPGDLSTVPLLLIHGDMSTGIGTWSKQLEAETERNEYKRRLIIVDRRGHGQSPSGPKPYTIKQDAVDLVRMLDDEGIDKVHIAGHSYGGLIGMQIASTIAERIQTLHLIEPSFLALLPDDPVVMQLDHDVRRLLTKSGSLTAEQITERFFTILMSEKAVKKIKERPVWSSLVAEAIRLTEQQFAGDLHPGVHDDFIERRETVGRYPVIVYTGGQSHPALQRVAREIARRCRDSHLIYIPEAGHSVQRIGQSFEEVFRSHLELVS